MEERTYLFARNCRILIAKLPKAISNLEDGKQLVRASGSIAANYIEANENVGEKDLLFRLKIARKESKECMLWLKLFLDMNSTFEKDIQVLLQEAEEIRKVLSAIISKINKQ